jgi:acetyl-CoA synthetase
MAEQIKSVMEETRVFQPPKSLVDVAWIKNRADYEKMHQASLADPAKFWGEVGEQFTWYKKWETVNQENFGAGDIKWFVGGKLNITVNALDRHIAAGNGNRVAIFWEGDDPNRTKTYTYAMLSREVNKFANVLKTNGVKKGDRVSVYLPMIPELVVTALACARIGAIHSIVFGGFSAESLRDRTLDATAKILITADAGFRAGKVVPLKDTADKALAECPLVKTVLVVKHGGNEVKWTDGRDKWYHDEMKNAAAWCEPEVMDAEDPLFMLYTSGSTGKPKGVLHTTAGYMVYTATTFKYIFDYHPGDVWFCTADIGWVTGHSYIAYAPLVNGATEVMFEGVPSYPAADRFWELVEKYKVTQFYTAPTAIRAIAREGSDWVTKHDLSSLKVLGTVGEPINPEAWMWYYGTVGGGRCPIVDTWWQTETGGILITPLPGAFPIKPGSATLPFFGVDPKILREDGSEVTGANEGGYLVIKRSWPGMMRTVYGDHKRFQDTYFARFPGVYFTGDGARRDEDGYYWLMGRLDDVINVSGHRLGTAEVESALVAHETVAEAAVVGMPHEIKGEGIYAYVILNAGITGSDDLRKTLIAHVRKIIGPIATPDKIQFADGLPKTRSGKIMRRILKKIAKNEVNDLGDTTTLADPSVVDKLVTGRL